MSPTPFTSLPPSKKDPIFAIGEAAKAAGPDAINGTVGMYMDEDGKPLMLPSVKRAIADIGRGLSERKYAYPHLLGLPEFRSSVTTLAFGNTPSPIASIATTGGTGAVAINLRLAQLLQPDMAVILPSPSWPNHRQLIEAAGMHLIDAPYLKNGKPTIEGIIDAVKKTKGPVTALLQVRCHNPIGLDLQHEQWEELADLFLEHDSIALLDIAYQGFAEGISEDASPIRLFVERGVATLVSWSASKNHSLYSERAGLAAAVCDDEAMQKEIESHYMILTRGLHSAGATVGQSIVARVQEYYRKPWQEDVSELRQSLAHKRQMLQKLLPEDLRLSVNGHGMFALLPLSTDEIRRLREEQNVFLTDDGRLNIAGIPNKRIGELCEKIGKVHVK